jgi:glycosyltransferase involved in cell wall biosynthesis
MNKKEVLLVVRWPVGGIRTFIRYVYRNFDPDQWRFTIIAPETSEMRVLLDDLEGLDISWVPVANSRAGGSSGFWEMGRAVLGRLAKKRFHLVHSHGFTSGMCAAIPAFARRVPHLMTSHDVINASQFAGTKGILKKRAMALMLALIDKIHSVSQDAQNNLISYFPGLEKKEGKCVVIHNGIETERFLSATARDLHGELELPPDAFLIGFFGRFMNQKGFGYLVEAMEMLKTRETNLPKRPLVLAFGEGGFMNREKRAIHAKGLDDCFQFMPFTPNVASTIKGLNVVVMPSLWEACPLLPMEALVCGTPLIASDCIGLREVTQNSPTIQVPMHNSQAIADALSKIMQNLQKEKFVSFTQDASEIFDVKRQAESLENLYFDIISDR